MRTFAVLLLLVAAPAAAWEPDTTHAGLTEQAALASRVHARLTTLFGARAGWLEPLALAPERAHELYAKLAVIEPTSGAVPDKRGRQSALAWLTAGSVVEGVPAARNRNHFYDPATKRGRDGAVAAPDWIVARDNDLGLPRFGLELERAVTAPGPAEREEHLAMALLCAGAMLHVLEDMGAPARARTDLDEFDLPLGGGLGDRGSRFERLAALVDGRLGVPDALAPVARTRARDFFTAADGKGLADMTHGRWYSSGTLPGTIEVPRRPRPGELLELVRRAQRYPSPRPEHDLALGGGTVRDADGVCLAEYAVADSRLRFSISDSCAAEQLAVILPAVGGYAAGFLDWLFRGGLAVAVQDGAAVVTVPSGEVQLGAGQLTVLGEDAAGHRSVLGTAPFATSATVPLKPGFVRIFAVFRGADASGEAVVAVGSAAGS